MRFVLAGNYEFDIVSICLHNRSRAHKVFLPLDWRDVTNHAQSQLAIGRFVFSGSRELLDVDAVVDHDYFFRGKDSL